LFNNVHKKKKTFLSKLYKIEKKCHTSDVPRKFVLPYEKKFLRPMRLCCGPHKTSRRRYMYILILVPFFNTLYYAYLSFILFMIQ